MSLQCRCIARVDIPRRQCHCTHPLIVTSLDTRPLKSTWTSCTNYTHARIVDTRCTYPLYNASGYEARVGARSTEREGGVGARVL